MKIDEAQALDAGETLSICSLRVGAGLYGIDTREIVEVLGSTRPQRVPLAPSYIAGVIPYRGDVLTTVCFRVLLGLEPATRASCVLVLYGEQTEEIFGLVVDGVAGVVAMARDALEANPSALDARSMALFHGTFKMPSGLMVRLDPQRLQPSRLAESGLFGQSKQHTQGEQR
jgi:purine-binding chemotaxis protein CheW